MSHSNIIRKLKALGYASPENFNPIREKEFRSMVVWLEDQKIRIYKIEERADLRKLESPHWMHAFNQYAADIGMPISLLETPVEQLEWLLGHAAKLDYADNVDKYKNQTADSVASSQSQAPKVVSSNPLDNLNLTSSTTKSMSVMCSSDMVNSTLVVTRTAVETTTTSMNHTQTNNRPELRILRKRLSGAQMRRKRAQKLAERTEDTQQTNLVPYTAAPAPLTSTATPAVTRYTAAPAPLTFTATPAVTPYAATPAAATSTIIQAPGSSTQAPAIFTAAPAPASIIASATSITAPGALASLATASVNMPTSKTTLKRRLLKVRPKAPAKQKLHKKILRPKAPARKVRFPPCGASPVKMAAWLEGYPDVKLLEDDLPYLLERMERYIRPLGDGNGPQFYNCRIDNGRLVVTCANRLTQAWFTDCVRAIQEWNGVSLHVGEACAAPKPFRNKVITRIPPAMNSRPMETIMQSLSVQNRDLQTDKWKILNVREESSEKVVVFAMADAELEKLKKRNLSLFLGFFMLNFTILKTSASKSATLGHGEP